MEEWLSLLISISKEVHSKVKPLIGSPSAWEALGEGAGGDVTRRIDKVAEDVIVNFIKSKGASCMLISEEAGVVEIGSKPRVYLIVDSIDGTTNALRGLPFFCTSMAVSEGRRLKETNTAVVISHHDGSIFHAERGGGAYLDGRRIMTSRATSIEESVIGVDINLASRESVMRLVPLFGRVRHIRHIGANALEICYVASGAMDGFVDIRGRLRVTDLAGAQLILKEAGGLVVTLEGEELDAQLGPLERVAFVAASNSSICKEILDLIG